MNRLQVVLGHICSQSYSIQQNATSANTRELCKSTDPNITSRMQSLNRIRSNAKICPGMEVKNALELIVPQLSNYIPNLQFRDNFYCRNRVSGVLDTNSPRSCYVRYTEPEEKIVVDILRKEDMLEAGFDSFEYVAVAADFIHKNEVVAAVVTCGGLCPGLNCVIQNIVKNLYYNYGVDNIFGIPMGFGGIWKSNFGPWVKLTPASVRDIHESGGTVLGSNRGGWNLNAIVDALVKRRVNQLYIIGGDGTHRGAEAIFKEIKQRKLKISVGCVPKTIDNDIGLIDTSFGFQTAVEEAAKAIRSCVTEARCVPNGIGITKLMGRHAGFIAAHAVLSTHTVDLCLIPEDAFRLEGVLKYVYDVVKKQGHAVVVIAEGAGTHLVKTDGRRDLSGNARLASIGAFLKKQISLYFKEKKEKANIKYHDPSYMIRSVKANASDTIVCNILAENAVHAAMCGLTGFTAGIVNNRSVLIPVEAIAKSSPINLNILGRTWERVCNSTQQPRKF